MNGEGEPVGESRKQFSRIRPGVLVIESLRAVKSAHLARAARHALKKFFEAIGGKDLSEEKMHQVRVVDLEAGYIYRFSFSVFASTIYIDDVDVEYFTGPGPGGGSSLPSFRISSEKDSDSGSESTDFSVPKYLVNELSGLVLDREQPSVHGASITFSIPDTFGDIHFYNDEVSDEICFKSDFVESAIRRPVHNSSSQDEENTKPEKGLSEALEVSK